MTGVEYVEYVEWSLCPQSCLRNAARPGGIAYQVADAVKHLD